MSELGGTGLCGCAGGSAVAPGGGGNDPAACRPFWEKNPALWPDTDEMYDAFRPYLAKLRRVAAAAEACRCVFPGQTGGRILRRAHIAKATVHFVRIWPEGPQIFPCASGLRLRRAPLETGSA